MRFRFNNLGDVPVEARVPIRYSGDSRRSFHFLHVDPGQTDHLVPKSPMDPLALKGGRINSPYEKREVLRCVCETAMAVSHTQRRTSLFSYGLLIRPPLSARGSIGLLGTR